MLIKKIRSVPAVPMSCENHSDPRISRRGTFKCFLGSLLPNFRGCRPRHFMGRGLANCVLSLANLNSPKSWGQNSPTVEVSLSWGLSNFWLGKE